MRKKLVLMLIITILINAVVPNFIYSTKATEGIDGDVDSAIEELSDDVKFEEIMERQSETGEDVTNQVFTEGTAPLTPSDSSTRTEKVGETATSSSTVVSVLCGVLAIPASAVNSLMTLIIKVSQNDNGTGITDYFTIENLVFNKYTLFDINFFSYDENSTSTNILLKKNIAQWYFALRNIAIVISVIILIYIGIRMAISTIAEEQAKYKKMFMNWLVSFILIFIMHYIVIVLLAIQDWLLDIVSNLVQGQGFEETIIEDTWESLKSVRGWDCVAVVILLYILVFYQIKFFLAYFKRFLTVGFLFIIGPLVTITYSIDAAGDGKAQAYSAWLKQIIYNIFIQVIHAVVYTIFIISAAEIAKAVPIMGALLLMTLSRTEKIVKSTFKLSGKGIGDEKILDKIKSFGK